MVISWNRQFIYSNLHSIWLNGWWGILQHKTYTSQLNNDLLYYMTNSYLDYEVYPILFSAIALTDSLMTHEYGT